MIKCLSLALGTILRKYEVVFQEHLSSRSTLETSDDRELETRKDLNPAPKALYQFIPAKLKEIEKF